MDTAGARALAEAIAVDGLDAHEEALAALLADALARGVSPTLVAVAAGRHEPLPARLRALGRVVVEHAHLAAGGASGDDLVTAAPGAAADLAPAAA